VIDVFSYYIVGDRIRIVVHDGGHHHPPCHARDAGSVDVTRRGRVVGPMAGRRVYRRRDSRLVHDRVPERDQLRRGHGRRGSDRKIGDRQVRRVSRGGRVGDAVARDRHGR